MNNAARNQVFSQMESQRHAASYAARPELTQAQQAQAIYHAMKTAITAGELDTARGLALALRPLLGFMPEGN